MRTPGTVVPQKRTPKLQPIELDLIDIPGHCRFSRTAASDATALPSDPQFRHISVTTKTQLVEHIQKGRIKCSDSGNF